jgi:hypothetical protein
MLPCKKIPRKVDGLDQLRKIAGMEWMNLFEMNAGISGSSI